MKIFLVVLVLVCLSTCNAVTWLEGNWAWNRDFPNSANLFPALRTPAINCYGQCQLWPGCTHFVWTSLNGGTCWMKTGAVAQSDAVAFAWVGSFCGIPPKPGQ